MKITIAQLNTLVGHLEGNLERLEKTAREAHQAGAELVVFPELFITGYPPKDLLDFEWFLKSVEKAVTRAVVFSKETPGTGILFGAPTKGGNSLFNTALLALGGEVILEQRKSLLPT
jgi:NAD+ synthase (glutamine-hydrolysing)